MTILKIQEKDVEAVQKLYTKIDGFQMPARPNLPGNGLDGYIAINEDGLILGAAYVFMVSNAPYCFIEWAISNRDYRGKDRKSIIPNIINHACSEMKEAGYQIAFAFASESQKLIDKYKESGFEHDEHWCRELIKVL